MDPVEATKNIFDFIDDNVTIYIDDLVDSSNALMRDAFEESRRLVYGLEPVRLISNSLLLFPRMIDKK